MRLFFGVFPPPRVQQAVGAVIETLRRPGDGISWVKEDNLHYTLRFMGELGEDGARRAAEAAFEAAAKVRVFEAALVGFGSFPNPRHARVLWAGMAEGAEPLTSLAFALEAALAHRGFVRAERPFAPHLTIGRVRQRDQDWSARLAEARLAPADGRFTVERLCLVQSTLSPKGSIYQVRADAPLAS